jgi:hypothetical protein
MEKCSKLDRGWRTITMSAVASNHKKHTHTHTHTHTHMVYCHLLCHIRWKRLNRSSWFACTLIKSQDGVCFSNTYRERERKEREIKLKEAVWCCIHIYTSKSDWEINRFISRFYPTYSKRLKGYLYNKKGGTRLRLHDLQNSFHQ